MSTQERRARSLFGTGRARWLATQARCSLKKMPLLCSSFLPQVQLLRQIWVQHYFWDEGHLRLRNKDTLPPAHLTLRSPYDPQAHIGRARRVTRGMGTKCLSVNPVILSTLISSPAFKPPMQRLPICAQTQLVHEELQRRHLLPQTPLVDAG
jgi:hypothetical protein